MIVYSMIVIMQKHHCNTVADKYPFLFVACPCSGIAVYVK